tara:strand:- start:12 stop:899 length:888 start_codon:yes stop_codon:yes gene_type:complete
MDLISKNLLKTLSGLGFCFIASLLSSTNKVSANVCPSNPSSSYFNSNPSCYITPDTYKITVYEMGLCTSDPLGTTTVAENGDVTTDYAINESSCSATFINENGVTLDLAGGVAQTLTGGTNLRPPTGTYGHAYIKIKNVFGLKGSYTLGDTTYYSKGVLQSGVENGVSDTDESNYEEWEEKLVDFDKGSSCEPVESNRLMAASETFNTGVTGTMKALLASVSGGTYTGTTQANCGDSTRIFGVFSPTNNVVISEQTQGLEVSFTITDRGVSVFGGNNPYVVEFGSGPFTPRFQTF